MPRVYVPERQCEWWTSRGIETALLDAGYQVDVFPIDQVTEQRLPADHVFHAYPLKVFGLQYKALYQNGADHWRIDSRQHTALASFPWIYYCLSDMRTTDHRRRALHLARFASSQAVAPPRKSYDESGPWYTRWGPFLGMLESCRRGVNVGSIEDALEQLLSAAGIILDLGLPADLHLMPARPGPSVRFSSLLSGPGWSPDPIDPVSDDPGDD